MLYSKLIAFILFFYQLDDDDDQIPTKKKTKNKTNKKMSMKLLGFLTSFYPDSPQPPQFKSPRVSTAQKYFLMLGHHL